MRENFVSDASQSLFLGVDWADEGSDHGERTAEEGAQEREGQAWGGAKDKVGHVEGWTMLRSDLSFATN